MTPIEKAKVLVHKLETTIFANFTHTKKSFAKQCAIIAVDEIIENGFNPQLPYNYWQEVKNEIEKL